MLVGRATECGVLDGMLDGARSHGRSSVLVVRGDPGIGKTALLDHARSVAGGLRVLRVAGVESEAELPYAGVHALLRPVADLVVQLPARHAEALQCAFGLREGAVADRFLVSLATLGVLASAAADGGLLVTIDDAHWLDRASVDAITFAARRLEADAVVLLLATRDEDHDHLATAGLPSMTLGGLPDDAAASLLGPRVAPAVRGRLVALTRGNPLALIELPHALSEAQLAGSAPIREPLPVGGAAQRAFLRGIRELSARAQAVALLVAADDTQDRATITAAAARLGLDARTLDELEAARLIRVSGTRLELRHPLVRSAVYAHASFGERRGAHLALAEVVDGERSTWHRAAAAEGSDAALAMELESIARRARRRSAHAAAAIAFERAAALSDLATDRARRLAQAAASTWDAGQLDRVEPLLADALPLLAADERDALSLLRGDLALERGRPDDAFELLVSAAADAGLRDGVLGMSMLARAAEAAWWVGDAHRARELAQISERIAGSGDGTRPMLMHFLRGTAGVLNDEFEIGVRELRAGLRLADAHDSRFGLAMGFAALHAADLPASHAWFFRLVSRLRAESNLRELPFALSQLAAVECWLGRLSMASSYASEAMRLARDTGQARSAAHAAATLAHADAMRGREADSRRHAAEAISGPIGGVALQAARASLALGRLEIALGHPEEALAHLLFVRSDRPERAHSLAALLSTPDLAEAAARSGQPELARPALDAFARWAAASGSPWLHSQACRTRALLVDGEDPEPQFQLALAALAGDFPFDAARTRLLYGEWLRRNRRRVDARGHLRAALQAFAALGAQPWAERARSELRATGAAAAASVTSTLDELTPQELHIAHLVADGATNRDIAGSLFLSVRTVEYHLQKTYRKLGISSRHALLAIVRDEEQAATRDAAVRADATDSRVAAG